MVMLKSLMSGLSRLALATPTAMRCSRQLNVQTSRNFHKLAQIPSTPLQHLGHRTFLTSSRLLANTSRQAQTKSDAEMSDFLRDEIEAEKESLKATRKPVQVKGFDVTTDDADVILKKSFQDEQIKISINVNHAVDSSSAQDPEATQGKSDESASNPMVCRPNFSIEIVKGDHTLAFNCSMPNDESEEDDLPRQPDEEQYQDMFNIDEFSIYKGEFKESTYVMSGEVMDGNFYDNLMNMLDERGINSEFVKEVVDFSTLYEQKLYVNLLENLQNIVKTK